MAHETLGGENLIMNDNAMPECEQTEKLAFSLGELLRSRRQIIATAESCTGGLIASALTEIPGSSEWFAQGLVTYSNNAKQKLLGVPALIFDQHGAVSEACVHAMAAGALRSSGADVAVAVSGVAGPGGGSVEKPVGTVWLAWGMKSGIETQCYMFHGTRNMVRRQAVQAALRGTIARFKSSGKYTK